MTQPSDPNEFQLGGDFRGAQVAKSVTLGPLEAVYQELFAAVLSDGVITEAERSQLESAADKLGLDRMRIGKLEQAMIAAYESSHRVRVVEHAPEAASLSPLRLEASGGDARHAVLLARVEQLQARVAQLEAELEAAKSAGVEVDVGDLSDRELYAEDSQALLRRVQRNPTHTRPLHRLYDLYGERGDVERQHWAAQALVALKDATPAQQELYARHRQTTLAAPRASISQQAWLECVCHPEEDVLTGDVFGVVAPAVLLGRVTVLRRLGQLRQPNPSLLQDPAKATLTAVRAVSWAAAVLGLPVPQLYVDKDAEHGLELVPGIPPHTVLGRGVLSGRTPLQQAFLAGRHLTAYRHDHFVRHLHASINELEDVFLAAVLIGNPGLPLADSVRHRVGPVVRAIEPLLDSAQLDQLRGQILRFAAGGGRTNLQRWSSSAEKTACRAGLVLCADLPTALETLSLAEPGRPDLAHDLIAYSVSDEHHALRQQLGINRN
jgi:hypothetical protein